MAQLYDPLEWGRLAAEAAVSELKHIIANEYGVSTKRLFELLNAEREGRLVVLPCRVGDTVWYRTYTKNATVDLGMQPHEVIALRAYVVTKGEFTDVGVPVEHFGVTAFLSREEAERALAPKTIPVRDLYDEEGGDVLGGESDGD